MIKITTLMVVVWIEAWPAPGMVAIPVGSVTVPTTAEACVEMRAQVERRAASDRDPRTVSVTCLPLMDWPAAGARP